MCSCGSANIAGADFSLADLSGSSFKMATMDAKTAFKDIRWKVSLECTHALQVPYVTYVTYVAFRGRCRSSVPTPCGCVRSRRAWVF